MINAEADDEEHSKKPHDDKNDASTDSWTKSKGSYSV